MSNYQQQYPRMNGGRGGGGPPTSQNNNPGGRGNGGGASDGPPPSNNTNPPPAAAAAINSNTPYNNNYGGGGRGGGGGSNNNRQMAWQPMPPTNTLGNNNNATVDSGNSNGNTPTNNQQNAAAPPAPQQQQQHYQYAPQHQYGPPPPSQYGGGGRGGGGYHPQQHHGQPQPPYYYNAYQQQNNYRGGGGGGGPNMPPPPPQGGVGAPYGYGGGGGGAFYPQQHHGGRGGGAMYYNNANATPPPSSSSSQPSMPPNNSTAANSNFQPALPRKPVVITDKDGNPLDFSKPKAKATTASSSATPTPTTATAADPAPDTPSTTATTTTTTAPTPPPPAAATTEVKTTTPTPKPSSSAGDLMRQMALERLSMTDSKNTPSRAAAAAAAAAAPVTTPVKDVASGPSAGAVVGATKPASSPPSLTDAASVTASNTAPAATPAPKISLADRLKQAEAASAVASTNNNIGTPTAPAAPATAVVVVAAASPAAAPPRTAARPAPPSVVATSSGRWVFDKSAMLRIKAPSYERPVDLIDMTVTKGPSRQKSTGGGGGGGGSGGANRRDSTAYGGGGGGGGGGGSEWSRGNALQQQQQRRGSNPAGAATTPKQEEWVRGKAPPKPTPDKRRGNSRGGRDYDMGGPPVAPLVKSENHWRPQKNTSPFVVAEKKVKSILNKMTKEKFERLAAQMMEVPILSYDVLNMMIENVYDKAIDEPSFGEIYADLCVRLSQSVQGTEFVHIIPSDEEPPTEGAVDDLTGESSTHTVYRWSADVSTEDDEVMGPFESPQAAMDASTLDDEVAPVSRGEMALELVLVEIRRGMFIKLMKPKTADGEAKFYAVFFPVSEAADCGQSLSPIFLSEVECRSNAKKTNSFKRSLLNKCEEEFTKQDIYVDWKKEKAAYDETKSTLTEAARKEKEEQLDFSRIRIKKQMLGNVKFIGQLYRKSLMREKIVRYCIASLLKLNPIEDSTAKYPEYVDGGNVDEMDEEDHEAICSLFSTIGLTIDQRSAATFMSVCFKKITALSEDERLPSRSRFMYKDLIDLRANDWVPRRNEGKAKTLDEIRKEVENEEQRQTQIVAQQNSRGGRGAAVDFRGSNRGGGDFRNRQSSIGSAARPRVPKPATETDADGFTVIVGAKSAFVGGKGPSRQPPVAPNPVKPPSTGRSFAALVDDSGAASANAAPPVVPLSKERFERRIKSMRADFMNDGGNVDELSRTFKELSVNSDAGMQLVRQSANQMMEAKPAEREAVVNIISTLYQRQAISSNDVKSALEEVIEYIDDVVMDAPRAYEYLGDLLGELLRIHAFDISWMFEQFAKPRADNPDTEAPEKLVQFTLAALITAENIDIARKRFEGHDSELTSLLGESRWKAIFHELL